VSASAACCGTALPDCSTFVSGRAMSGTWLVMIAVWASLPVSLLDHRRPGALGPAVDAARNRGRTQTRRRRTRRVLRRYGGSPATGVDHRRPRTVPFFGAPPTGVAEPLMSDCAAAERYSGSAAAADLGDTWVGAHMTGSNVGQRSGLKRNNRHPSGVGRGAGASTGWARRGSPDGTE